jgi:threonine/homoserine/homoserine lactone efflux protein
MSAQAFQVIKIIGSLYLLYLAWGMWRDTGTLKFDRPAQKTQGYQIALKGLLINILNPKLTLFFFAFLPQFISPEGASPSMQMLGLCAVFMGMTFVIFSLYGLLSSGVSTYLSQSPKAIRWVQRSFALIFAGLAAKLAFSEQ